MEDMIRLEGISRIYRTKEVETLALENVNLEVKDGEFVSVMGPSGCGKVGACTCSFATGRRSGAPRFEYATLPLHPLFFLRSGF